MRRLRESGRIRRGERPWPRLPQRAPMAARSHRFCARSPRRAQFRPRPCAAAGRAGASPPHIPWPRVRIVPVHGRRGRARRRDGPALLHPTSHGRAFAALLCTIAAGVRSSGRGRARRRDGLALPHPTSHGRAFASFLCTIAAGVRRLRESGRIRRGERPWPRLPQRAPMAARSHRFCARSPQAYGGGGTGRRFFTPHPPAARSHRFCARSPRACAAEGRAGAFSPHIPWPRVRVVSVHDRRRRAAAAGRAGASSPHIPRPHVRSVPVHGRRGVRSSGRGRSRRSNSYRARGGFAPTAAVRRRRAPLRSRSAPRAGRDPRGRSGRRPRSAGRWGGAGRASR